MDAGSTGTGLWCEGYFLITSQSLDTPTSRFILPRIIWWHSTAKCGPKSLTCQHNWLPVPENQVYLCWNGTCSNPLLPSVNDSGVTARAGQFLCSQHLGAAGAFPAPCHSHIDVLYIIYRRNIQSQGQGRCWEDNRLSPSQTCWIYTVPWHSLVYQNTEGWEFMSRTREQPGPRALPEWQSVQGSACCPGEQ